MSNYFKQSLKVLVQGATGREGQRAIDFMQKYRTNPLAGVTPGKGGQEVLGVPIFNSIEEARQEVGALCASTICVPALAVRAAVQEAVENEITLIHVLTERVPYRDLAYIKELCKERKVKLVGPGSLGILSVGEGRIGFLGGFDVDKYYIKGNVSLISRSGGMTNEIAHYLCKNGIGLRTVVHLGSDLIAGTTLVDQLKEFMDDSKTHSIAVFEEVVNNTLLELAVYLRSNPVKKTVCVALAGMSQSLMPTGVPFGHADALLKQDQSEIDQRAEELLNLGVKVVDSYEKIPNELIK